MGIDRKPNVMRTLARRDRQSQGIPARKQIYQSLLSTFKYLIAMPGQLVPHMALLLRAVLCRVSADWAR